MIYLCHEDGRIAEAETEATAQRVEGKGFYRCSEALHLFLWRRRDRRAALAMWPKVETAPLVRAVGR